MRTRTHREGVSWGAGRIWTFFVVVLVVVMCSALVGTQSVRASSCTSAQCTAAYRNYVIYVCGPHAGVGDFECPASWEPDDFFFICHDGYSEQDDCGTNAPS